jgi:RNA polymerase sigma-70 factor (sigma-E family)
VDERDANDFEAFVRAQHHALLRFAYAVAGDLSTAEDLVQAALERTGVRWSTVRRRHGDPGAYVRQAILNGGRSRWRARRREQLVADIPDVRAAAEEATELAEAVWQALGRLPRRQRAVVVLRFYEDLSVRDTARMLGCSEGTVKSQTAKALATLKSALRTEEPTWS